MAVNTFRIEYDFGKTNEQVILDCIDSLVSGHDTKIVLFHNSGGLAQLAVELGEAIANAKGKVELEAVGYVNSAAAYVFFSTWLWAPKAGIKVEEQLSTMYHCPRYDLEDMKMPLINVLTSAHQSFTALYDALILACENAFDGYAKAKYDIGHEIVVTFPKLNRGAQ
ncbi:hypothetical protein BCU89_00010 [Vibrio splendidus]|nr:hypothetical protein BCU89_00010 [Vibrio splendidus]